MFTGPVRVARRQIGCMRFCYVPPGSRTPRRYRCQPDLVEREIEQTDEDWNTRSEQDKARVLESERLRVRPQFNSTRYGRPTYCQLALAYPDANQVLSDEPSMLRASMSWIP